MTISIWRISQRNKHFPWYAMTVTHQTWPVLNCCSSDSDLLVCSWQEAGGQSLSDSLNGYPGAVCKMMDQFFLEQAVGWGAHKNFVTKVKHKNSLTIHTFIHHFSTIKMACSIQRKQSQYTHKPMLSDCSGLIIFDNLFMYESGTPWHYKRLWNPNCQ